MNAPYDPAAILDALRGCASCGDKGHTIWACPDEARKDRELSSRLMEDRT